MTDFATTLGRWSRALLGLLAVALVATGCDAFTDEDLGDAQPQTPTIAKYIQEVRVFSSLEGAVAEAGLTGTLESSGPFTVFAPVDDAFSPPIDPALNQQVVKKVIQHHVVDGEVTSDQLSDGQAVTPLSGDDLTIGLGSGVTVNRASVTNADAEASNGVVHVIDGLLIDAVDRATLTPRFTIFARLVSEAGLEDALRDPGANGGRTIFVPTNEALLAALDSDGSGSIESDEIPSNADEILQYHVHNNVLLSEDLPSDTTVTSLEGSALTLNAGDDVSVNPGEENAGVTVPDVVVDNGVIHGIGTVLTP